MPPVTMAGFDTDPGAGRLPLLPLLLAALLAAAPAAPVRAADEPVPVVHFNVQTFTVEGDNPLGDAATQALLAPFLGEHAGVDGLRAAADALEQELATRGYAFHRVTLPPQRLNEGNVVLRMSELAIGEVTVSGNEITPEWQIRATVPALRPGETPNVRAVGRALDFANLNPVRELHLTLKEGKTPETIDAQLRVDEHRPWQVYGTLNNIGTEDTGRLRMSIGGLYGNLWNRDHRVAASYTLSPDNFNDVMQVGFQYQIPLYFDSSTLSLFYIHSDVDVGQVGGFFDVSGAGDFVGITYDHRLFNIGRYSHGWQLSLQDRLFENQFAGETHKVRSRPVSVAYDGAFRTQRTRTSFYANFTKNLTNGAYNADRFYVDSPRVGADAGWEAFRFGGTFTLFLPREWLLRTLVDVQYADQALIAGEQFGIGGAASVRGFEERAIAGDSGYRGSIEIWTPQASFIRGLRALAFFDIGEKWSHDTLAFEPDTDTISSVGGGLRWQWQEQIGFNLDYGYSFGAIQQPGLTRSKDSVKWHFALVYRY
ncbi:MAG: ShlB/FhaC/HecB family hemolysin secretion/activation protein [Gammaproteobacteria bacterium]|nr:ShlB/FhaC/HecB family hemolysin secretion/activation protein [Gammaproteobacteria bacterium]